MSAPESTDRSDRRVDEPDVTVGLVNVRDLGGLPTADGGRTRSRTLFRSDAPYEGDLDPADLDGWPPATVIDLRGGRESQSFPRRWSGPVQVINHQLYDRAQVGAVPVTRPLDDLYRSILREVPERVAGALSLFDPNGATLVHCAAGKDRTGIVIAIALTLAGVDADTVIDDYQRTGPAVEHIVARLQQRSLIAADLALDVPVLGTPRAAIELVLDVVTGASGGAWGWLEHHGGDVPAVRGWVDGFVERT
ncbi:tyrosine-protein phosphatase [Gordonia soli]|uniref:Tyrosine specific protein phosphatases domain-containing protein n=1 Tax=Gordonia soli NBRC 108243 TaxID=1223545 RepID=M0QGA0_9ACTN|nr:tyrosine-protein phosphatase [Gordonia soli]GAC66407.1 putative protein-tyrosine-phosphatase [Gordonia soli NBRC 108243]